MFLARASVARPVAATAIYLVLVIFGVNAFRDIGLDTMPRLDVPFITIITIDPGSTPTEIERSVAKKIEDAVVSVDGLKHVHSVCRESVVQTLLEFEIGVDVDDVAFDVSEKIDLIRSELPASAEDPEIQKFDVNAKPVATLALTGDLPLAELYDLADRQVKDRFSVLRGVADVEIVGGAEREVEILLDRGKMAAAGLTALDVVEAVRAGQVKVPAGRVKEGEREYSLVMDAEAVQVADLERILVRSELEGRLRVGDLARVRFGQEELRQASFVDGAPCIGLKIVKKGEANTVRVVERIRKTFEQARGQLPGGTRLVWVDDDKDFIQASVNDALANIIVGVLLTAAILLLFLHEIRTTFIVALTMPLSMVITFAVMKALGYTFNTSTLLGIGISVGVLVANSIVVIESFIKLLGREKEVKEAAVTGTVRVAVAVLASAATNVVVFIPIATMTSIVGKYFGPFAVTVAAATVVSLFISFTLTPMLGSILLRRQRRKPALGRLWDRGFGLVERSYRASVSKMRVFPAGALLVAAGVLVWSFHVGSGLGMDFAPTSDQGQATVQLEFDSAQNLEETVRRAREVEALVRDIPGLQRCFTTVGKIEGMIGQTSEGVYLAEIQLYFGPKTEREESIDDITSELRRRTGEVAGALVTVSVPEIVGGSAKPLEMEISGDDLAEVERLTRRARAVAEAMPGLVDLDTSVRAGRTEIRVYPDRAILADMGLPVRTLGLALRGNLNGIEAGVFRLGGRSYDIRVKLAERRGRDQVPAFALPGPEGRPLRLAAVARTGEVEARTQIMRAEKRRVGKLFANLAPGVALGDACDTLMERIEEGEGLPPGYEMRFVGMREKMGEVNADFMEAAILAMFLTYLVLCAVLESWLLPFIVIMTVPMALVGIFFALGIAGQNMNMFVLLAGVMLVGLVVNNAILLIEGARQRIDEGDDPAAAMIDAAGNRFRPIVMTSLAAVLGMLPMALGSGVGSEMRSGTGLAAVGGLVTSALLSLYVIPALWFLFHRRRA